MSFKNREENFVDGVRNFTCYSSEKLRALLEQIEGFEILDIITSDSAKENAEGETWTTGLVMKR